MAGIGFELRRLLQQDSYLGLLRAYGYAGIIGSGPWVLSILAVMALGIISATTSQVETPWVTPFLVSVTWLVAASLIMTGTVQLLFTRFVADRLFEKRADRVLPNLIGLLSVVTMVAALVGLAIVLLAFNDTGLIYRLEMLCAFILLCNIWCVTVFVAGIKAYHQVLGAFALGYGATLGIGLVLRGHGLEGLLAGFVIGQSLLLFSLLYMVVRDYPSRCLWAFELHRVERRYLALVLIGLFYNLGIWADKLVFWFNPDTSEAVIGPLRASPIHDLPLFLAYLSIVPGMAVFLMRMETDFAERCSAYYDAVREGDTLEHIEALRREMVASVRRGIYDIFKIQGITVMTLWLLGAWLIESLGFSAWYLPLFNVFLVAVGIQVLFMAILNVLFYLDRLWQALWLCLLFVTANFALTLISQQLGPAFYGYGYALSLLGAALAGLALLDHEFQRLTYQTFMLQPSVRNK
ncbi:exopolysaccharide Pel transporter PelG [Halomonas urumqiensis]|uniref:Histidine kinase n=1 Tax=Halomonas urumqiensis TaxID=1684789 RepID=A0A2N7UK55_9GAMM|nr:exopolysaccharide Pel transporter PelG [Halomonas urumqiensis]PMR80810.1 histidine kinase [Halomonas urumqiensis]PTB02767.1 histidine kinase [Halomonas urumqiensis]GHE21269.1 pellicle/biofilm biosynthesis Wzx-like polysaccharide transporter PelG [Halomonas urumqiensis]